MNEVKKLNNLKEVLEAKGIKASFIAKSLNYNPNSVYNWLHQRSQPSLSTLSDISNLIGVPMSELIANSPKSK
jgi:transcriptional regulator with XRE-family HTH domain